MNPEQKQKFLDAYYAEPSAKKRARLVDGALLDDETRTTLQTVGKTPENILRGRFSASHDLTVLEVFRQWNKRLGVVLFPATLEAVNALKSPATQSAAA